MPSLFDCLESAIQNQLVRNPGMARQTQADFQDLVGKLAGAYPLNVAQGKAAAILKEAAARGAASRRHTVIAQLMTAQRNTALISRAPDYGAAVKDLIEGRANGNGFESVRTVRDAYRRQLVGMIHELLAEHGTNIAGEVRNKAQLKQVVQELHGQASGSAVAARIASAVQAAQTRARTLFNAHGGDIGELADFGLPHSHEIGKIRAAGFDGWRAQVYARLAWERIEDAATGQPFAAQAGQLPADPRAADRFLRDVYDGLVSRGWDARQPSMSTGGGKMLANRRAERRVMHFRDADAWMAYNDRFGAADPFRSIVSHLEGMARDVALMRVLGPNPAAGLEHAIQVGERQLAKDFDGRRATAGTDAAKLLDVAKAQKRAEGRLTRRAQHARAMLGAVTGANNVPADEASAAFLAGTRQILTGAQLGSAILSSPTDLWTMRMAARSIGMNGRSVWARHSQLLTSAATRETAARMGYVADTLADAGSASARYLGDVWSPEVTSRITNGVLRASGLSFWTDCARQAWQMEFSGFLASQAGQAFADLPRELREVFSARGITAADWDRLRDPSSLFTAPNGAKFLSPLIFAQTSRLPRSEAEGLSVRLGAIIEQEMEFAVPSVSIEGRTGWLGDARPGTFSGELLRSGLMYKSFGLSVTLNLIRRAQAQRDITSRAVFVASMIAGLTVFGSVSVQLKEMAKGRDTRPMNDRAFWGAAFLQGGGFGIFGDFLTSEVNRMGGGWAETLTGPVVGLGADIARTVLSNGVRAAQGKDVLLGRDLVNLGRRYTPGASLWQIRLAMDRLVWDQLQWLLDPEARGAWARQEAQRDKANSNASWWGRGEIAPERGPDFSNVAGDRP